MKRRADARFQPSRRERLKELLSLGAAPWLGAGTMGVVSRMAGAEGSLATIRMGIQIFTGAVATVWYEKRVYEKRGLKVDAKQMPDGRSVRDAMIADRLDVGTMNLTPFLTGASTGTLTMIGNVSLGGDTVGLMVKTGAGINNVADLRNKRIGITVGSTTGNLFVNVLAPEAGLHSGDYRVINMKLADQVAALASNSVDAITTAEPYLSVAEKEGLGTVLLRFGKLDPNPTCLVVATSFIQKQPETVNAFCKSWLDGVEFWRTHRKDVVDVVFRMYRDAGYTNLSPEIAESIISQIKVEPFLTPDLTARIRKEADDMRAKELIKVLPDWSKALRPDLLEAART
jgi:ABC-type nitrate/sulfonate/bicarbonate transport system substrate-binding protein